MAKQEKVITHTAPGQMAGYLFQPDRALVLLCSCKNDESVSIELVDDLATMDALENVVYREQDKSSIQDDGQPFKDRSKDLWNTLLIWSSEIQKGTINIGLTKLACVTNKKLEDNSLLKKISLAKTEPEVNAAINLLKTAGANPPDGLKVTIEKVLADEAILKQLIPQITLLDDNNLDSRNAEIANELHLSDDIKDNVIESLRGWMNESILKQFEAGKAPRIQKSDFNNRLQKAISKESDDRIQILAKKFVKSKISKEELEGASDSVFVKQLELIEHPDKNNIILDAIDDFLCAETERTRLTIKGDLTRQELEAIDDSSKDRWTEVFRRKITQLKPAMTEDAIAALAFDIYDNTVNGYLAKIRGYDTEPYFTKGSFHRLSDDLEIGWHPDWQNHFKE